MRIGRAIGALVLVAVLVNLPVAHGAWQRWQLARAGHEVSAEVVATDVLRAKTDPHYVIRFRLPEEIDPERRTWPAEVDRAAWRAAEETGRIGVRVLPDRPSAQRVDGAHASAVGYIVIGVVDLIVLLLGLLIWRHRRGVPDTLAP